MRLVNTHSSSLNLKHKLEATIRKSKAGRDALLEAAKTKRKQTVEVASSFYVGMLEGIKATLSVPNFGIDTEYGGYPHVHQVLLVKDGQHNSSIPVHISVTQQKGWDALSVRWREFKDKEGLDQGYWKAYGVVYHLFDAMLASKAGQLRRRSGTLGEYGTPIKVVSETAKGLKAQFSIKYPALPTAIDTVVRGSFVESKEIAPEIRSYSGWKSRTHTLDDMLSAESARPWLGLFAAEAGKKLRNSLEKV